MVMGVVWIVVGKSMGGSKGGDRRVLVENSDCIDWRVVVVCKRLCSCACRRIELRLEFVCVAVALEEVVNAELVDDSLGGYRDRCESRRVAVGVGGCVK